MSVSLNPSSALSFHRPLTKEGKCILTITNNNSLPVAFKVKTTAPKLYCVRPNAGRIEPSESVAVSVQLQPVKEEPSVNVKCKDKFLVQSTLITTERETIPLSEIWSTSDDTSPEKTIHHQRIRVVYLPPEGQEEESIEQPSQISDSQNFETIRDLSSRSNGHPPATPAIPSFESSPARPTTGRSASPLIDESFVAAHEEQSRIDEIRRNPTPEPRIPSPSPIINVNVHSQRPSTPPGLTPAAPLSSSTTTPNSQERELAAQLAQAQEEIQRLRQLLAQTPDLSEVRRRGGGGGMRSDETVASTEMDVQSEAGTFVEHHHKGSSSHFQEGASPQQVGIIALLVFVITYLFF